MILPDHILQNVIGDLPYSSISFTKPWKDNIYRGGLFQYKQPSIATIKLLTDSGPTETVINYT